jgi:L-amino acid N-acyltransferase YncA
VDSTGSQPISVSIRPATSADAASIVEIYNREVLETTATFDLVPRTLAQQQEWLSARSGAFAAIVAVEPVTRQVLGFAALSPYKERAAYRTTVEDSIYVHRDFNGRGIGKALLGRLIEVARESGFHSMIGRIEAGGDASRALHAGLGFALVGIEREVGRKFNRWLDVAVMQLLLEPRPLPAR